MSTLSNVKTERDKVKSPCTGLTPDVLPEVQKPVLEENSQTGVSTKNTLSGTDGAVSGEAKLAVTIPSRDGRRVGNSTDGTVSGEAKLAVAIPSRDGRIARDSTAPKANGKVKEVLHWYALRVTYGREKKAYDYLINKNIEAFYPTITTVKVINGKRKSVEESRLPNIFFAYGTEEEIKSHVYDNVNLPYLRFYYRHFHEGMRIIKKPLIVPDYQIESLKIICASEATDIILVPSDVRKFETGQAVRIIDGGFKGIIGKVARYQGQQRVAVVIEGLLTIATAYIPNAFLEKIH